ncbi:unnamed protein product [Brugia timori]|uniref:LisH domain-containing protein n=1 Tax=Brugia timori TaxID=42155 RepID=A0A0R3QSQ8_9BILA|nr:unnamed protein product [Brugia timori]
MNSDSISATEAYQYRMKESLLLLFYDYFGIQQEEKVSSAFV